MSGITFGTRLGRLLELRDRIDAEIAEERGRAVRIAQARQHVDVRTYDEVLDDLPADVIRAWARANGIHVAESGRIGRQLRQLYLDNHPDAAG